MAERPEQGSDSFQLFPWNCFPLPSATPRWEDYPATYNRHQSSEKRFPQQYHLWCPSLLKQHNTPKTTNRETRERNGEERGRKKKTELEREREREVAMEKCGKGASLNYEFSVGSCLDVGPSFTVQSTADIPPCGYHSDISGKLWVRQLSVVSHHHLIQYLHGLLDIITPIQGIIPMDSPYRNHIFSFTSML